MIDCNQLVGRGRDICRGHDDLGNPVSMTGETRWEYIQNWIELKKLNPITISKEDFIAEHNKNNLTQTTQTKNIQTKEITTIAKGCGCGSTKKIKEKIKAFKMM
jgi:hypothetical protein